MDLKRFGLFLLLSWVILFGFNLMQPPPPKPAPGEDGAVQEQGVLPGGQGANVGDRSAANGAVDSNGASLSAPEPVAGAEPWQETLILGQEGERGRYQATFNSLGGVLAELRTGDFFVHGHPELDHSDPTYWMPLVKPVRTSAGERGSLLLQPGPSARDLVPYDLDAIHWNHEVLREGETVRGVRFFHQVEESGLTIEKILRPIPGEHQWSVELALSGGENTRGGRQARFTLTPVLGMVKSASDPYYTEPTARACGGDDGDWELDSKTLVADASKASDGFGIGGAPVFGGVDNKYFAMLLRPAEGTEGELARSALMDANWRMVEDVDWASKHPDQQEVGRYHHVVTDLGLNLAVPDAGTRWSWSFTLYAGPKERKEFASITPAHEKLLRKDLGFFDGIGTFLLNVLNFFHGLVGNWGMAIILLTLTVRLALFPFNRRSQTAMAKHATKMKRVQPKITEIKEKYKNDPRKQREAQAKIMQEKGAFPPLGGCLPPLVQIPIFFGLFSALRVAFDLRQERFLWVEDLSMPDRFMHLGINTHLPFIGVIDWLNVLPILMVVLWIAQQKVMPKPTDPQAQQMHKMMMWMPIIFGVFLYNYSAGLSLYMVTSSLFGIFEYTVVRKIWPLDETETPKKAKGKFATRWAEMMKEAQRMQEAKAKGQAAGGKKSAGGGKGKGKR